MFDDSRFEDLTIEHARQSITHSLRQGNILGHESGGDDLINQQLLNRSEEEDDDDDDLSDEPEVNSSSNNAPGERDSMVLVGDHVLKGVKKKKAF